MLLFQSLINVYNCQSITEQYQKLYSQAMYLTQQPGSGFDSTSYAILWFYALLRWPYLMVVKVISEDNSNSTDSLLHS